MLTWLANWNYRVYTGNLICRYLRPCVYRELRNAAAKVATNHFLSSLALIYLTRDSQIAVYYGQCITVINIGMGGYGS